MSLFDQFKDLQTLTNPIFDTVSEGIDTYKTIFEPEPAQVVQAETVQETKAPETQAPVTRTANIQGPPVKHTPLPGFLGDAANGKTIMYVAAGVGALVLVALIVRR